MLIGWPRNQTLPTSEVAPLASAVILFLLVDQLKSLDHVMPCQPCRFTVEIPSSRPLFSVAPTFCSVDVKPDVTGRSCVSKRSCVFILYQSIVPEMRLLITA